MSKKLLRCSEVAERLGLKESSVRKWIFLRWLPVVRIGGIVRIREEDVAAIICKGYCAAVQDRDKTPIK